MLLTSILKSLSKLLRDCMNRNTKSLVIALKFRIIISYYEPEIDISNISKKFVSMRPPVKHLSISCSYAHHNYDHDHDYRLKDETPARTRTNRLQMKSSLPIQHVNWLLVSTHSFLIPSIPLGTFLCSINARSPSEPITSSFTGVNPFTINVNRF
jgi:hypothetical protein